MTNRYNKLTQNKLHLHRTPPFFSFKKHEAPLNARVQAIGASVMPAQIFYGNYRWTYKDMQTLRKEVRRRQDMALVLSQRPRNDAERENLVLSVHDWIEVAWAMQNKYTPLQCKERYAAVCASFLKPEFKKEDLNLLVTIANRHNGRNWPVIAEEMKAQGLDYSAIQCFKAFKTQIPKPTIPWTPQEVETLKRWMNYYIQKGEYDIYFSAATRLPGRSYAQCYHKWVSLQPQKLGKWSAEEDEQLKRGYAAHGEKWALVQNYVPTRNGPQCRDHWAASLDPRIVKGKWTDAEIRKLVQLVKKYGMKKNALVANEMPGRTDCQVICFNGRLDTSGRLLKRKSRELWMLMWNRVQTLSSSTRRNILIFWSLTEGMQSQRNGHAKLERQGSRLSIGRRRKCRMCQNQIPYRMFKNQRKKTNQRTKTKGLCLPTHQLGHHHLKISQGL